MNCEAAILTISGALLVFAADSPRVVSGGPPTDVCSLVTSDQVSAVLGVTVSAGQQQGQLDCRWSQPGSSLGGKAAFLHILRSVGTMTAVDQFNTIKRPVPFRGIVETPMSGVGDDAVYVTAGAQTGFTVKKGNSMFHVRVHGFPLEQIKAKEMALTLDVLTKL